MYPRYIFYILRVDTNHKITDENITRVNLLRISLQKNSLMSSTLLWILIHVPHVNHHTLLSIPKSKGTCVSWRDTNKSGSPESTPAPDRCGIRAAAMLKGQPLTTNGSSSRLVSSWMYSSAKKQRPLERGGKEASRVSRHDHNYIYK